MSILIEEKIICLVTPYAGLSCLKIKDKGLINLIWGALSILVLGVVVEIGSQNPVVYFELITIVTKSMISD